MKCPVCHGDMNAELIDDTHLKVVCKECRKGCVVPVSHLIPAEQKLEIANKIIKEYR